MSENENYWENANAVDIEAEVGKADLSDGDKDLLADMLITPEMLLGFSEKDMALHAKTFAARKMGEQENAEEARVMKSTRKKVEGNLSPAKKEEMFNQALDVFTEGFLMQLQSIQEKLLKKNKGAKKADQDEANATA